MDERRDDVRNNWLAYPTQRRGSTWAERKRHKAILAGDSICHVCKRPGSDQVDHVRAKCLGGTDHPDNLKPIHRKPCHLAKTAREANHMRWHVHKIGKTKKPSADSGLNQTGK